MLDNRLFTYKATCYNVVDGDTIDVTIDLGWDTWKRQRLRLLNVDTFERGHEKHHEATQFTENKVLGKSIIIQSKELDSFGRSLAIVWYKDTDEYRLLSNDIIDNNYHKPMSKWNNYIENPEQLL